MSIDDAMVRRSHPGPGLDHTRTGGLSTFAIIEHKRRGWRMNIFARP
jgi:hypothetical protein